MSQKYLDYFEGQEIRREIGDYKIYCQVCLERYIGQPGLNYMDWAVASMKCTSCLGMNREPIPLAEVINFRDRKMGNKQ